MRGQGLAVLLVVAVLFSGACSGGGQGGPNAPTRPLPSWSGHGAELFDDVIEPSAVGMDLQKSSVPKSDPVLRERAQTSDAVLRVKVTTVTAKLAGPDAVYQLGLHTVEKLSAKEPPGDDFTVTITKASDSHGIMKSFENRLVGYPFVAFVREFVRSDGDREIHFHLAPDTKEVKSAVGDAVLLGELK
ncbi:MAG TPA: cobalamin ABC transporter substrate-binding protein [Labilithrix sp.]|jgi:hypothetical protein